jgi:stage II sporulation protein R
MIIRRSARWIYLAFVFTILLMSWESQLTNPALAASNIPEEAIRMRILANSDSPEDQWVKQQVRDRVMAGLREWVTDPTNIESVRAQIRAELPELERIVGEELRRLGAEDEFRVSYGSTDFPPKVFGRHVYPAGRYESLLIEIGEGKGMNWWCVMFPPLCFADLFAGGQAKAASDAPDAQDGQGVDAATAVPEPEVKFFLVELIEQLVNLVKGWF